MPIEDETKYLLALHSSTKNFGIAVIDLKNPNNEIKSSIFELDVNLSNYLFKYVQTLIPVKDWTKIARLAVATGPGSFTGTRITIAMAKTLAQQINCEVDGISNFALMAPRISKTFGSDNKEKPFWIMQSLKRRGYIAGQYQVIKNKKLSQLETLELRSPYLLNKNEEVKPVFTAIEDICLDVNELMRRCLNAYINKKRSPWEAVTPLYPTSPVRS